MKLNRHAALRAIGATLSAQHTCKEREYWTLPESLQDKPDFYDMRETIPFQTLLSGFRDSGFIVYLDKPIVSDTLAAAAPDLLAALENACNVMAAIVTGDLDGLSPNSPALIESRAAIAKARGK